MSVIYISFYISYLILKPIKHPDGFTFDRLCDGNVKLSFIDTRRDMGLFLRALIESAPSAAEGQDATAYTAMLSFNEIAELWSEATGQPAKHGRFTMNEVKKKFPTEGDETNSVMYAAELGYVGVKSGVLEPKDPGFTSRPSDIKAWMMQQDWSGITNPQDDGSCDSSARS